MGAAEEKSPRLTRPGQQAQLIFCEKTPIGGVRSSQAAAPHGLHHPRQTEIVAQGCKAGFTRARGVGVGLAHAFDRPVGAAKGADAAGLLVRTEDVDELAHRHLRIIAVHEVDIGALGLQPLQAFVQLAGDFFGEAVGRMRAFGDEDHLVADTAVSDPPAQEFLLLSAAVDIGGVKGIAAGLEKAIEHRCGVRHTGLVVAPQH